MLKNTLKNKSNIKLTVVVKKFNSLFLNCVFKCPNSYLIVLTQKASKVYTYDPVYHLYTLI